ncbi:MAG: 4-phosphopantetheinyl transferase [Solirubrobacteraceae bacterium]|nr:4-phosphopantetheinyl transferase [Solirubrobacteraceae bacterium]
MSSPRPDPEAVLLHWRAVGAEVDATALAADELRHVAAMAPGPARQAQTASYALRREVLAAELGCAAGAVALQRACAVCGGVDHGKPWVAGGPSFSVSRARATVVMGLLHGADVGVDVEVPRTDAVWRTLEDRLRHPDDDRLPPLAVWTAKEAVLKLAGCGLTRPMADVALRADGTWTVAALRRNGSVTWTALPDGAVCAVATDTRRAIVVRPPT